MSRPQYSSIVEMWRGDGWVPALYADDILLMGQQRLLGSIFGVDGQAGFVPVFAGRGLPRDVCAAHRESGAFTLAANGTARVLESTWATWEELSAVDWGRVAENVDACVHCY